MENKKITKRTFDNEIQTSLLGFGCMRFPQKDGKIDEELAKKMLDHAIACGVNYIDTAYPYHDGDSEPFVGKVLDKYPRDSYYLATKLPCWKVESLEDAKNIFNDQLKRLHKDYIDFYLLHALNRQRWPKMKELGVVEYCEQLKREGKIRRFGFSFHDDYNTFEEIVNSRDWDFCQIQLNYMDTEEQAGLNGYKLLEEKNIPLVVMEPVKGGSLAVLPDEIFAPLEKEKPGMSAASWALRWVGTLPGVKVILSGMSSASQVEDNIHTFTDFEPLSEREMQLVENTAAAMRRRVHNGCTGCGYCMPCPAGVDIPRNFRIWNQYGIYNNHNDARWQWKEMDGKTAAACVECGKCENVCPQHLSIRDDLKKVKEELDGLMTVDN